MTNNIDAKRSIDHNPYGKLIIGIMNNISILNQQIFKKIIALPFLILMDNLHVFFPYFLDLKYIYI